MASALMKPVPCDICENPAAKFHCNTCGDTLCATCKIHHLKSKGSRHHIIVPYAQKLDPKLIAELFCNTHKENTAEYWCETCCVQVCLSCITKEHKGHEISNMASKLSEQRDAMVKELKMLRDTTVVEWEDALKQAQDTTKSLIDNFKKIDKELVARADEIHQKVNAILSKRRKTLQQMMSLQLSKLQEREKYLADKLQQMKVEVQQYEDQLIRADSSVFLQFKVGTIERKQNQQSIPAMESVQFLVFIKTKNDGKSIEELFGQISMQDISNKGTSASNTLTHLRKTAPGIPQQSKEMDSALSPPKNALIGSLIPPIVVSKFHVQCDQPFIACNNLSKAWVKTGDKTIKLMDKTGSLLTTMYTKYTFNDIALAPNGDVILTNSTDNCISSISATGKISTLFRTKWTPYGLCCLQNGDIVVTFYGRVIKFISTGAIRQTYYDIANLKYPLRVAGSTVNTDIYIVDRDEIKCSPGRVLAVGDHGQLRWEYFKASTPSDVCTDKFGHILITDMHNNLKVFILNQNGHFMKEFCFGGLLYIDVNMEGHAWVSHRGGEIEVYKYLQ